MTSLSGANKKWKHVLRKEIDSRNSAASGLHPLENGEVAKQLGIKMHSVIKPQYKSLKTKLHSEEEKNVRAHTHRESIEQCLSLHKFGV